MPRFWSIQPAVGTVTQLCRGTASTTPAWARGYLEARIDGSMGAVKRCSMALPYAYDILLIKSDNGRRHEYRAEEQKRARAFLH
jgi:hypothetical protein